MKKATLLLAITMLAFSLTNSAQANPFYNETSENSSIIFENDPWQQFGENLVVALKSDHDGLKVSAMGMVIRFGNKVDVKEAVFDVMRIYNDHKEEDMRRMAVIALGQMDSPLAIAYLTRAEKFEQSAVLKQTIHAVINDYHVNQAD